MIIKPRKQIKFDLTKKEHVECYKQFLIQARWPTGCPFELEYPWNSVPDMIKDKLIKHFLKL
jgi:radical SAM superfamily enzyme YgiQ (UPF0313 family)